MEFIARPTSFSAYEVSVEQTKSSYIDPTYTADQLTALEKKVVNAYFLIFKPNGSLYEFKNLGPITDNIIPS